MSRRYRSIDEIFRETELRQMGLGEYIEDELGYDPNSVGDDGMIKDTDSKEEELSPKKLPRKMTLVYVRWRVKDCEE